MKYLSCAIIAGLGFLLIVSDLVLKVPIFAIFTGLLASVRDALLDFWAKVLFTVGSSVEFILLGSAEYLVEQRERAQTYFVGIFLVVMGLVCYTYKKSSEILNTLNSVMLDALNRGEPVAKIGSQYIDRETKSLSLRHGSWGTALIGLMLLPLTSSWGLDAPIQSATSSYAFGLAIAAFIAPLVGGFYWALFISIKMSDDSYALYLKFKKEHNLE